MDAPKRISVQRLAFVVGILVVFTACGGKAAPGPPAPEAGQPPAAEMNQPVETSGGDDFWADIPTYPDSSPAQQTTSQVPVSGQMGEFRTLNFRYYETGADVGTVADFYLDKMPDNGWTKVVAMDFNRPTSAMSSWVKRDGDVAASVSVGRDNRSGKTYISVMRGEGAS
jgi:hypothetical protein